MKNHQPFFPKPFAVRVLSQKNKLATLPAPLICVQALSLVLSGWALRPGLVLLLCPLWLVVLFLSSSVFVLAAPLNSVVGTVGSEEWRNEAVVFAHFMEWWCSGRVQGDLTKDGIVSAGF